ncbi:hypothetical protein [Pseudomonas aeruginosa]|uniref:hypothetical protein n=2 Tax=Pseudomonas aeruginosa TaxID=287 RepID=UPI000AE36C56|nr:hypothetical protein [Pseudomonas aeruginosa]
MTHALFKQIDLTAKLGQDGSSLQAMNALRVIRETVAKHLASAEGAGEIPLERALQALHTIAEFPCSEQDDLPAANMRQIALAALSGAGAGSEPGNPGREPVSGPGNAGGLAEAERPEVVAWLVVAKYPHKEARRAIFMYEANADDQGAEWCCDDGVVTISPLIDRAFVAQAERIAGALRAELQSQRERNTELIFKLGSATNGWGRCEKERDALATEAQALREEVTRGNRIIRAMALDLAAVGEVLGIPAEQQEGGAGEFIEAIQALQEELGGAAGQGEPHDA